MNKSAYGQKNLAAFYLRISKEDDQLGESASIESQRKILRQYIDKNNLILYDEYIDDYAII